MNSRRLCALVCWYLLILCSPIEAAEESPVNLAPNISAGKYLFQAAGGCSCHTDTKNNSAFLAGGRPIETPFGLHLVWIEERSESRIPPYPQVRAQVLEDWFREATRKTLRREIERHRENVEIRIIPRDQTDRTSAQRDGLNEGGRGPDTHQPELMDGSRRRDMQ